MITKSKYYFFCNDLSKKIELKDAPQIIIHCASANKNSYDLNAKINLRKNIDITKNIINYANSNNVKKIFSFPQLTHMV